MLTKPDILKNYYKDNKVVDQYIIKRFKKPLGSYQHIFQVRYINHIIEKFKPKNLLEIACGPGRLTSHIKGVKRGYAIDSSEKMLDKARKIIGKNSNWIFIKKDAFNLDFDLTFDLVYSLRFLRHFKLKDREKIYKRIRKLLNPSGLFIFDAPCLEKYSFIKKLESKGGEIIYDKIFRDQEELKIELEHNGFELIEAKGYIFHFYIQAIISRVSYKLHFSKLGISIIRLLENAKFGKPLEWMVICKKG